VSTDWEFLLRAFLHDPPDKAIRIPGHQARAARYLSAALGCEATDDELHWDTREEDQHASAVERLPFPRGERDETRVGADGEGRILVTHPLSGEARTLEPCRVGEDSIAEAVRRVSAGKDDMRSRFLALWRRLPDKLAELSPDFMHLPADTRVPDHTIWNHIDITAGLHLALKGSSGAAFLSFQIGPVQSFIAAARTVRDLWTGSALLSWLTFRAMLPVVEELGPTAVVFPALRGLPLMDTWLRMEAGLRDVPEPDASARRAPCVPNRFLAVVPHGDGEGESRDLAAKCEKAARGAWAECCEAVRCRLNESLRALPGGEGWDRRWDEQVGSFFEIRTAVLPWRECGAGLEAVAKLHGAEQFEQAFPDAARVRGLADAIPGKDRPRYGQKHAGRWQALVDLSARLMEAQRVVRHVPPSTRVSAGEQVPPKCTMFGTYEQMGPGGLEESATFWKEASRTLSVDGVRLRRGERLCAVGLVKRFAAPAFLCQKLGLNASDIRYHDTATVAAAKWLKGVGIDPEAIRDWSGQWLHWSRRDQEPDDECPEAVWGLIQKARRESKGAPPAYYAVLAMDADEMGKWLRGEKSPRVGDVLHPKMREYFEGLADKETKKGLDAPRPMGPALHAAISEALTNFAVRAVPAIVEKHDGSLIYAGGDDVLALLPARSALACALELRRAFRGETGANGGAPEGYWRDEKGRDHLVMGPKATIKAGLAVVHYKDNLRDALDAARKAEKAAKDGGRDALVLTVCRRSGEHSSALCPWDLVPTLKGWVEAFEQGASERGASDRWAYHLRAEMETLGAMPTEAVAAEIRRQVNRAEKKTRELFGETGTKRAGDVVAEAFGAYVDMRNRRVDAARKEGKPPPDLEAMRGRFLEDFLTLVQSASFLARGRDL